MPYRVGGVFAVPGERVSLEALGDTDENDYIARTTGGTLSQVGTARWTWIAPLEPGLEVMTVARSDGEAIRLNVFVMIPYGALEGEELNGYRIGAYPSVPLENLSIYRPPKGFIEVTRENESTWVSPHFRLKQFLCKQAGGYPKYVVLQEKLLLKLELLLARANERGYPCDTFFVMSGYRTPYYNKAIGNVRYSRHLWGGAADIFIDVAPRDGRIDDLNGDGRIDVRDASVLYEMIDRLYGKPFYAPFFGGLGRYRQTSAHGPFVHVDVRGFRARWGS